MTILVDMDGTIELLVPAWVAGLNEKYGYDVSPGTVTQWDISASFPGLSREQVNEIPLQVGFWSTVKPIPGAAESLKRLIDAGHDVYIVTATQFESVPEKIGGWLFEHFPFLTEKQIIITYRKQLIRGDVLIDDGVHNLEGGDYVKILMTAPHNEAYDAEAAGMIRVRDWAEIEEVIERLSEDKKDNKEEQK